MATCPNCQSKSMSAAPTGEQRFVAAQLGDYSLSGMQAKVASTCHDVYQLTCNECPFEMDGYIEGGHLVAFETPTVRKDGKLPS